VAAWSVLLLEALDTDDASVIARRKLLITNQLVAFVTLKTFLVPLTTFVFEFLHSYKRPTSPRYAYDILGVVYTKIH